ncbi:MAG TPA: substrate-binding domain-containing protein [Terriglobales bacterium]
MKRAGIHQIAQLAKVSIGTVDRALHGRSGISDSTRKRVLRIARELSYSPNPAARALSVGRASVRIGVCIPEEIHFFYDQMRAGIFDEGQRVNGVGIDLVYRPATELGEEKREITNLLQSGVSAIIVTPGNPHVMTPLINRAEKDNVRVICVTTDAPNSNRSSAVCVDPEFSGRLAAELMAKLLPAGSETAIVTGMMTAEEHRQKTEGFRSAFPKDCPGGKTIAVLEAHESEKESYEKTCELLAEHKNLRGIYVNTVNSLPVCKALQKHNLAHKLKLITTDLFRQMVPYFERRTIAASIYQDPYLQGQLAVRMLADHLLNGAPIPKVHYLNPAIVLRTNLLLFRETAAQN